MHKKQMDKVPDMLWGILGLAFVSRLQASLEDDQEQWEIQDNIFNMTLNQILENLKQ